jgi:hypothetical protein
MVVVISDTTSERQMRNAVEGKQPTAAARTLPPDMRIGKGHYARTIGAFIPKVAAAAFEKFGFHTAEIMTSWETIVGSDLARMTRPEAIKWPRGSKARTISDDEARATGATLVVACNPAFALEISYRTPDIVDRINRYFGYRAVAQMRVIQAPKPEKSGVHEREQHESFQERAEPPIFRPAEGLTAALDALRVSVQGAAQPR